MKRKEIDNLLSYCLYLCDVDDLKNKQDLDFIHKKIITDLYTKEDIDNLVLLKERLMKQFK
jgi:hypothetical protein